MIETWQIKAAWTNDYSQVIIRLLWSDCVIEDTKRLRRGSESNILDTQRWSYPWYCHAQNHGWPNRHNEHVLTQLDSPPVGLATTGHESRRTALYLFNLSFKLHQRSPRRTHDSAMVTICVRPTGWYTPATAGRCTCIDSQPNNTTTGACQRASSTAAWPSAWSFSRSRQRCIHSSVTPSSGRGPPTIFVHDHGSAFVSLHIRWSIEMLLVLLYSWDTL